MQITNLKLQFKMGPGHYSISVVDSEITYSALSFHKNLNRFVASKITDAAVERKVAGVLSDMEKAIEKRGGAVKTASKTATKPAAKSTAKVDKAATPKRRGRPPKNAS